MCGEIFEKYKKHMRRCLELAEEAGRNADIPVGALVVDEAGDIIGTGYNTREQHNDPVGHAEINALRDAAQARGSWRLYGCTLIVTLEPCTMCAGAIILARITTLVFGVWDPKAGAAGSIRDVVRDPRLNHQAEVIGGILEEECSVQLKDHFRDSR